MRNKLLSGLFFVALIASCLQSQYVRADAVCYVNAAPTPVPTSGQATLPICINGILQTSAVLVAPSTAPTPTPVPTPAAIETTVASSVTSVTLLGAGVATNGVAFCNNSTAIAYLSMVTPATSTSMIAALAAEVSGIPFCFIQSNSDLYHGAWYAIWAAANGTMTVTHW
jgi:hypothetical protein